MWPSLSIFFLTSISVLKACIPTESPDDRPDIPGVFTTTAPISFTTTTAADIATTTTTPTTTTTSTTTTTTTTTSTTTTTTTSLLCPVGYELFMDPTLMTSSCYRISTDRLLWPAAQAACAAEGAHLVVIHSQTENDYLTALALRDLPPAPPAFYDLYHDSPWIGVSCTLGGIAGPMGCGGGTAMWNPANYMNVDGTPVDYANWASSYPAGLGQPDHNCGYAQLIVSPSILFGCCASGEWHDMPCAWVEMSRYICEIAPTSAG